MAVLVVVCWFHMIFSYEKGHPGACQKQLFLWRISLFSTVPPSCHRLNCWQGTLHCQSQVLLLSQLFRAISFQLSMLEVFLTCFGLENQINETHRYKTTFECWICWRLGGDLFVCLKVLVYSDSGVFVRGLHCQNCISNYKSVTSMYFYQRAVFSGLGQKCILN